MSFPEVIRNHITKSFSQGKLNLKNRPHLNNVEILLASLVYMVVMYQNIPCLVLGGVKYSNLANPKVEKVFSQIRYSLPEYCEKVRFKHIKKFIPR